MTISDALLPEFDQEMAGTRRVLERAPVAHWGWRPHKKSWTLGELASHIANIPAWTHLTLSQLALDIAPVGGKPWKSPLYRTRKALLAAFDQNVDSARAAIAGARDSDWGVLWSLLAGGQTLFSMPRAACVRSMILNHSIHHRAQLCVYLRLKNVPVPGLYGPSADES